MYQPYVLKYDYNTLSLDISRKTLEAHYHNHYLKYLRNLNNLLAQNNFKYQFPLEDLFQNLDIFKKSQDAILYNAGGVVNHELYFDNLDKSNNTMIPEPLKSALISKFGSIDNFKNTFIDLGNSLQGSGYTFLVVDENKNLKILNLKNQESPFSFKMTPIIALDVWEHAYYIDYGNNRKNYVDNFWKLIDFSKVNEKYQKILKNRSK